MASDISSIVKSEIISTLESLLSVSGSIDDVKLLDGSSVDEQQCVKVESDFEYSGVGSKWQFFIPTITGTKFEYLMLGGIADLKDAIDDEISDAAKEIVSTICGSITTSVNAQGFDDISNMKFSLGNSGVVQCPSDIESAKLYRFSVKLNDESLPLIILFDEQSSAFVSLLTQDGDTSTSTSSSNSTPAPAPTASNSVLSTILGEESVDNLRLLFDIKMRLSVRLGTKVCLLKDVISWDIGEIIELTQMTNEPLDILVNGVVIGHGEAVIVDGKFGVKIKNIGEPKIA